MMKIMELRREEEGEMVSGMVVHHLQTVKTKNIFGICNMNIVFKFHFVRNLILQLFILPNHAEPKPHEWHWTTHQQNTISY